MKNLIITFIALAVTLLPHIVTANAGEAQQFLDLLNKDRGNKGSDGIYVPKFCLNSKLSKVAQEQAEYCARTNVFTHQAADGSSPQTRIERAGFKGTRNAQFLLVIY